MANYMAEVAKMLGVEMDEEFEIYGHSSISYKITINGISVYGGNGILRPDTDANFILKNLLTGLYTIKGKPWKPESNERYYTVCVSGHIIATIWDGAAIDILRYKVGNCYRTREEAETNRDKWVAFYKSDEVLEA